MSTSLIKLISISFNAKLGQTPFEFICFAKGVCMRILVLRQHRTKPRADAPAISILPVPDNSLIQSQY